MWAYLTDNLGFRVGDSIHLRIPAPELEPTVRTLDGATVSVRRVTARGEVVDTKGAEVERLEIEWSRSNAEFEAQLVARRAARPEGDGVQFVATWSVPSAGRWYYRAALTTVYGTSYGEIREVEVSDYSSYLPVVTTDSRPVSHTATTVTVAGRVESDGGLKILERGFCGGTSLNPTLSDSPVTVTGTTGQMKGTLSGVPMDKTFYYRAYATNEAGTAYGEVQNIRIRSSDFEVDFRDLEATVNTSGEVTIRVRIRDDRGQKFKERGFCWKELGYNRPPTIADKKKNAWSLLGSSYEVRLSRYQVTKGKRYRVRAYVITNEGVVWYSSDRSFDAVYFTVPEEE